MWVIPLGIQKTSKVVCFALYAIDSRRLSLSVSLSVSPFSHLLFLFLTLLLHLSPSLLLRSSVCQKVIFFFSCCRSLGSKEWFFIIISIIIIFYSFWLWIHFHASKSSSTSCVFWSVGHRTLLRNVNKNLYQLEIV